MTTFAGYTAFLQDTDQSRQATRVLATAVPQLKGLAGKTRDNVAAEPVPPSPAFQTVAVNAWMFTPTADTMPKDVPSEYRSANLEHKDLRGKAVTRLFLPVSAKDPEAVQAQVARLDTLVRELFGDDLLLTKTRTGASTTTFLPSRNKSLFNSAQQPAPAFKLRP